MKRDRLRTWIWALLVFFLVACQPSTTAPSPTATVSSATSTPTPIVPTPSPTPVIYVIQPGDSLSAIAAQYGIEVEVLAEANGIQDPNVIKVGQELVIPGPTAVPTATIPPTITPTPNVPPQLEIVQVVGRGSPTAETVVIANQGRDVSLANWTLRDEQGQVFFFPNLYLTAGSQVRVHTGKGENTPQHLYWNSETSIWAESGDKVILADDRGVIYDSQQLD